MHPRWIVWALIGATSLPATTALGQPRPERAHENGHHQLLQIELRGAIDRARALHQYAHDNPSGIAPDVVARHLDAIADHLNAIDAQISEIQEIDGDGLRFDLETAEIRNHNGLARESLVAMQPGRDQEAPDVACIDSHAATVYHLLSRATDHDRRTLSEHRVRQPVMPTD